MVGLLFAAVLATVVTVFVVLGRSDRWRSSARRRSGWLALGTVACAVLAGAVAASTVVADLGAGGAAVLLGLPVLLALLGVAVPSWRRLRVLALWVVAVLLTVFALVTGLSVGLMYAPAAVCAVAAALAAGQVDLT